MATEKLVAVQERDDETGKMRIRMVKADEMMLAEAMSNGGKS